MQDLSLNEIADRITTAILQQSILSKQSLNELIRPILKVWLNQRNTFKPTGNHKVEALLKTIEQRGLEKEFWRQKAIQLVGKENMQPYYDEWAKQLKEFQDGNQAHKEMMSNPIMELDIMVKLDGVDGDLPERIHYPNLRQDIHPTLFHEISRLILVDLKLSI